jgi:hypothetical protein
MAKTNTTLLLVGAALVAGFILYKKGLIKIPGMPAVLPANPGNLFQLNNTPLLPPITQLTVMNPNIQPPVTINAPDPTGMSLDLGF